MGEAYNPRNLDLQHPSKFDGHGTAGAACCHGMTRRPVMADKKVDPTALRCRALTLFYAAGNSVVFAAKIGVEYTRWNNIENTGALSKDVAFKIVRTFPRLSTDWLWLGDERALTVQFAEQLNEAVRQVSAVASRPRKRKHLGTIPRRVSRDS